MAPVDVRVLNRELLSLLDVVFSFLVGIVDDTDLLAAISTHSTYAAATLHVGGAEDAAGAVLQSFAELRALILRMHVIKRTDFIPSGERWAGVGAGAGGAGAG